MISNLDHYKKILEEERLHLEQSLEKIGRINPENPEDWEVSVPELNPQVSEKSELADQFEEFETRAGIEVTLEERLNNVKRALERIDDGSYGKCEECGKEIDEKRLEANPAALKCIEHANG